jgi:adenylosuccinate lyase
MTTYKSPFSTRYGSAQMRTLWSERTKRLAWRRVWVAVAEAQAAAGLITPEQIDEIKANATNVDIDRAREIEAAIDHDLVAELQTYAEQCPTGGGVLHWGLTSADVQDNAEVVRQRAGLAILLAKLKALLLHLSDQIDANAELPVLGFTHLQPAEPTTLGHRLSQYGQDLLHEFDEIIRLRTHLRGKGIRGAVGTSAPFVDMLADTEITPEMLEATVMQALNLSAVDVATQTYPRIQDFHLIAALSGLSASLHKMAFDLRLMQSPGFRAASEPFHDHQVGSSAMPFKRNPVHAEKICSLARQVAAGLTVAWQNAASALLERTLDDSANRRSLIPETFLACDEMLTTASEIIEGLQVDAHASADHLRRYGPFAAVERLLTALVREGADRQEMHERLRQHSMSAWKAVQEGKANPISDLLASDTTLLKFLQPARVRALLNAENYVGQAPARARHMAERIRTRLTSAETSA